MIGRGLVAALRAQLRRQFARMATRAAGYGLMIFGVGLMTIGGVLALAQLIGPIAAFCGSGVVLVVAGLFAAQSVRPRGATQQSAGAQTSTGPQPQLPPPSTEVPAAAAVVFVLGFVAVSALLRAKGGGQD